MALMPITPSWPPIFVLTTLWAASSQAYFADWSLLGGRPHEPTCVDIPKNMSLCSDIGYDKMRLPNLLDHDTLTEVQQQSGSWVPLLNVQCHPHTKLFLCSLFTPVCLESQIFPCRSLCNAVQQRCEARMRTYGYHWPDMLRCDKFPEDNDMCIKAPHYEQTSELVKTDSRCAACDPVDTYENILDNFCRADTVLRTRIKRQKGKRVSLRKVKILKSDDKKKSGAPRNLRLLLQDDSSCCKFSPGKQKYLIMGYRVKKNFITPTFVLPWKKSKNVRQAVKTFRNLNCDDPNLFTSNAEDGTIVPKTSNAEEATSTMEKGKRKRIKNPNRKKKKNKDTEDNRRKNRKRKMERKNMNKETDTLPE